MRVLFCGASGIIGQYCRAQSPAGVDAYYHRRTPDVDHITCDLHDPSAAANMLKAIGPQVVVNLAGESNTDTVEREPNQYKWVNSDWPGWLAGWCQSHGTRMIHISTQAVFSGNRPPYSTDQVPFAINEYGRQKKHGENAALMGGAVIIRPTFVLGVRLRDIGRANPIEQMLGGQSKQVDNRWFSPSFAPDVADVIWREVLTPSGRTIIHAGVPMRTSRYEIALALGVKSSPVPHESFAGIAPRPVDTTYAEGDHRMSFKEGIADCLHRWEARQATAA
jgi:dTDP-4-dehydrorhamnose reductase